MPVVIHDINYLQIEEWLKYCDNHPDRLGDNFYYHAWKFSQEGYCHINQLTGPHISIEQLSEWLNIKKGVADLLIQYAEHDIELVKTGQFSMVLNHDILELDSQEPLATS
jgi:hypothetical protein